MRNLEFINDRFYHLYNRGVDKRDVFGDDKDYIRFIYGMREFNNASLREERIYLKNKGLTVLSSEASELSTKYPNSSDTNSYNDFINSLPKFVEIICYCLNPNHYHLILRQLADDGISKFMHKISVGYTNYFNLKYKRSGSLFQGEFKAIHIDSEAYLASLSAYVNPNTQIHGLFDDASKYPWCSYPDYLGKRNGTLCNKDLILNKFVNIQEYKQFVDEFILKYRENKLQKYFLE